MEGLSVVCAGHSRLFIQQQSLASHNYHLQLIMIACCTEGLICRTSTAQRTGAILLQLLRYKRNDLVTNKSPINVIALTVVLLVRDGTHNHITTKLLTYIYALD